MVWAPRVSFAVGYLTFGFAKTREPLARAAVFEASESTGFGSTPASIMTSSVLFPCLCGQNKVHLPDWVRKGLAGSDDLLPKVVGGGNGYSSLAVVRHHDQKQLKEERVYFSL